MHRAGAMCCLCAWCSWVLIDPKVQLTGTWSSTWCRQHGHTDGQGCSLDTPVQRRRWPTRPGGLWRCHGRGRGGGSAVQGLYGGATPQRRCVGRCRGWNYKVSRQRSERLGTRVQTTRRSSTWMWMRRSSWLVCGGRVAPAVQQRHRSASSRTPVDASSRAMRFGIIWIQL